MKTYSFLLIALLFLTGTSCTSVHHSANDEEILIKLTSEDWDANFLAGNPDASVDFYTEDAVRIQDGMILNGREDIRDFLTSEIRPGFTVATSENKVTDVRISHDLATVRGTFLGSWVHAEWGDTLWRKAAWVDICERQEDGSWKMVFTMGSELRE
jgi:uncharacterized protein (TIGR02246 family)